MVLTNFFVIICGSALIEFAKQYGATNVDVNEQNLRGCLKMTVNLRSQVRSRDFPVGSGMKRAS